MKKDYRLYVIHMLPHLRTLDYNRITQKVLDFFDCVSFFINDCSFISQERESSRKLYKTKGGDKAKKKQKGANTFVPGGELAKQQQQQAPRMTKKDADTIKVFDFLCFFAVLEIHWHVYLESHFGSEINR